MMLVSLALPQRREGSLLRVWFQTNRWLSVFTLVLNRVTMQQKNMKRTILITAATLLVAGVSASAADVKETWEKSCAKCHGPDGKGETKIGKKIEVKDFTDSKVQASYKDEDMVKAIKQGIKDGEKIRMKPAEGVTDDDVKALVAYVRGFKK